MEWSHLWTLSILSNGRSIENGSRIFMGIPVDQTRSDGHGWLDFMYLTSSRPDLVVVRFTCLLDIGKDPTKKATSLKTLSNVSFGFLKRSWGMSRLRRSTSGKLTQFLGDSCTLALNTRHTGTISSERSENRVVELYFVDKELSLARHSQPKQLPNETVLISSSTPRHKEILMAEQKCFPLTSYKKDEQIISVDILSNTNFFQAFTALANVPAIYLQHWFGSSSRKKEKEKVIDADMEELLNLAWIQLSATEESDSTIPDPSHQTVMSTPPVIAPFTVVHLSKPSLLAYSSTNQHGKLPTITISPEITPYIALQLRVARLEQEMSEVKKTDHSADVVASIKSQVPMAVDKYLRTKLDDALLKVLERHTADLIEKYSVLPGPESVKNQESEKSPKEIIRAKQEQGEEKQDLTYSIRSTNTVDLEEFDLKNEDAMDKEVEDKVKDHKRKHDSDDDEDDDDDEGPLAGSNQGNSAKRRRHV
ncbi:hypothetical protein Tco_1419910 [Tanacetum coccineum]